MAFKKGESGNPAGRKRGVPNKATDLRKYLEPHAEELLGKLVELAKEGNMNALRLVVERLLPPKKENRISVDLPDVSTVSGCCDAQGAILAAVASGDLLLTEGDALSGLVENRRKALETKEIAERLSILEERL